MDELDRIVIDTLQDGFPVCERPFLAVAQQLGTTETELIARVDRLLREGTLTRFGPLFAADRLGGELTLCAMQVPHEAFDGVAHRVNAAVRLGEALGAERRAARMPLVRILERTGRRTRVYWHDAFCCHFARRSPWPSTSIVSADLLKVNVPPFTSRQPSAVVFSSTLAGLADVPLIV